MKSRMKPKWKALFLGNGLCPDPYKKGMENHTKCKVIYTSCTVYFTSLKRLESLRQSGFTFSSTHPHWLSARGFEPTASWGFFFSSF
jgi:hypothetical protein